MTKSVRSTLSQAFAVTLGVICFRRSDRPVLGLRSAVALVMVLVAASAALAPEPALAATAVRYPSTDTIVTTGWTSAPNAYADDASFATAAPGRNGTVNSDFGGFGFDTLVPAGSTINSVTVEVNWYVSTNASIATLGFQPYVSGVAQGSELSNGAEPTAETIQSQVYTGLTRDQLLDAAFAVRVRATRANSGTAFTAYLDYVKVTVDYTAPSTTITLADGTNPGTVSITAGGTGALDGFSLRTNTGTAAISSVTVNVTAGSVALSGLSINGAGDCTGTSYGSIGSVASGTNLIDTSGLSATTTETTFYVCATGATVASSTAVSGTVSTVATSTSGYTVTGSDPAGATSFTVTPSNGITTVGDAANPPNATVPPAAAATAVDAFTLRTDAGSDTISSVTATLPPNVWAGVEAVSIQDVATCTQATPFGSAAPTGTAVVVPVSGLVATPTLKPLWVCVKPRSHAAMPPPPGTAYAVTARVTGLACSFTVNYQDTSASATVTIDNASPANATWGTVTTGATSVTLNWTNPASDFGGVVVLRRQSGPVANVPAEGATYTANTTPWGASGSTVVYVGSLQTASDSGLTGGQPYYYAIFAKDPYGNYAAGTYFGPVYPGTNGLPAGDPTPGTTKPVVGIVSPGSGAVVAATTSFRVQVRVWSPGAAITGVAVTSNNGGSWTSLAQVAGYGGGPTSGVWGGTLSIASAGGYTLVARASSDGSTWVYSRSVGIVVNEGGGDGRLLVRDNASQLCTDCHAMTPHGSEAAGTKYGSWTTTCRDCHTPHGTTNIHLVPNELTPPAIGSGNPAPKTVYFTNRSGYSSGGGAATRTGSYANGDNTGVCQVCHTRTKDPLSGNARYQSGGGTDHNPTEPCRNCHAHGTGFAPTNKQCWNCHLATNDTDVWTWGGGSGPAPIIDTNEWTTFGHGATTSTGAGGNYPSGNVTARFDTKGSAVNDRGCFYCHSSSTSHNDSGNWFRLNPANFNATSVDPGGDGWNSVCLICHGKTTTWTAPGFDPDGGGAAYALVTSTRKLGNDHAGGASHGSPDHNGGNFCWDCHDPHGDRSMSGNELWFMVERLPVEQTTGTTSGVPQSFADAIEFRGNLGGDARIDYPDYVYVSGTSKGLCRNCHDCDSSPTDTINQVPGVNHYCKGTSDGHNSAVGVGLSPRDRCTDCHVHAKACNECHNAPEATGRHPKHNEVASLPTSYAQIESEATATQYGFRCAKCHQGTHPRDTHAGTQADPFVVDMVFDASADPKNPAPAAYGRGGTVYTVQGAPNGDYSNSYWGWTDGTCSNLYCHSNGAPLDAAATPAPINWNSSPTTTCTSCHAGKDVGTPPMSSAHAKHVNSSPNGYGFTCDRCHVATGNATAITNKANHVNGVKDVVFDASGVDNSGGSYTGTTGTPNYTCSNTYCHSNGTDRTPPYASGASLAWTASTDCRSCHGFDSTASPSIGTLPDGGTATHAKHVNNAAVLGTNFVCASCHKDTVSAGNAPITGSANHVDGTATVAFGAIGSYTGGSYSGGACSSVYCHSSGQATPVYVTPNPSWTGAAIGCNGCHGIGSSFGEPSYGNGGPGAADANSHAKHVGSATDCAKCHNGTTTNGTAIKLSSTLHIDGGRQVTWDATRQAAGATYLQPSKTCGSTGGSCHGPGSPQWGAVVTCLGCHGTTGGEADDFGASFWNNGIIATLNTTEWTWSGHGKASGSYDVTGNPAAAFPTTPTAGTSECLYCHDSSVAHGTATNPYRLLNIGGSDGMNGNCLACHKTGSAGVNGKNGTTKADASHDGAKHTLTTQGGVFCWDCHEPHGDRPSNTNSSGYNIEMIRSQIFVKQDGSYGYLGASGVARSVEYYSRSAPAVPASIGSIVETTTAPLTAHKGICQACHDSTSPAPNPATAWTKYWDNVGYDDPDGAGGAARYASGAATPPNHNPTGYCITCHKHGSKFAGGGGGPDCLACHGTSPQGSRRAVTADFANGTSPTFRSHHVGNGGVQMGGTLSNADCAICHAEAVVSGGTITGTDPTYHANGKIDLRDVDSTTAVFAYDRDAVAASAGAAANWNSGNAVWRTQMSANLDPFCVNCHDANGASQISAFRADPSATATNPFNDTRITNEYDQLVRCNAAPGMPGATKPVCTAPGVVNDVKTRLTGTYSRHPVRGQSTSLYTNYTGLGSGTSMYDFPTFTSMGTDENGRPNWNDTSVMGCADCHTTDGANREAGNAHGSSSEYLLKDKGGGAAEGTYAALTYVCYRCHLDSHYLEGTGHTGNAGDFCDSTGSVGTSRSVCGAGASGGSWVGYACGNCHGTTAFGGIHGTSEMLPVGSGATINCNTTPSSCREGRRFTNGASLRYYDPQGWTGTSNTCYTIGSAQSGWSGCTKHGGGQGRTKPFARPITY